MFYTDKLPSLYLVFGLVENDAFDVSVSKNPYNFQHFDINEFYLLVNGTSIPTQPVKLDTSSMDYHPQWIIIMFMSMNS